MLHDEAMHRRSGCLPDAMHAPHRLCLQAKETRAVSPDPKQGCSERFEGAHVKKRRKRSICGQARLLR